MPKFGIVLKNSVLARFVVDIKPPNNMTEFNCDGAGSVSETISETSKA